MKQLPSLILNENEMTAARVPDPHQRVSLLGGLDQPRYVFGAADLLTIDGLDNIAGSETRLRDRRVRVKVEHHRTLHIPGNSKKLPNLAAQFD